MEPEIIAVFIPIVGVVMGIGIGAFALYLSYRKRREVFTLLHQERMAAIERGLELPPLPDGLLTDGGRPTSPHRHLLKGLVWLFVGLALLAALLSFGKRHIALFGLIPAGVGAAHLLYYFLVGKREAEAFEAAQRAKAAGSNRPPVMRPDQLPV